MHFLCMFFGRLLINLTLAPTCASMGNIHPSSYRCACIAVLISRKIPAWALSPAAATAPATGIAASCPGTYSSSNAMRVGEVSMRMRISWNPAPASSARNSATSPNADAAQTLAPAVLVDLLCPPRSIPPWRWIDDDVYGLASKISMKRVSVVRRG
jgi:hypothetical protein